MRGSSNQLNVSGQISLGGGYYFRMKYPIVTAAPANAITGAGDLSLYDLKVIDTTHGRWLAGFTMRVPTASDSTLGTGKYSIGPALTYQMRSGPWTLGFFTQDYFSVIGPSSRAPVGKSKFEPVVFVRLPADWTIGLSSMSITYDWVLNKWTEVPVGLRIGHRFGRSKFLPLPIPGMQPVPALRPLEAALEAEQNLSNVRAAPGWTTRLSVRWSF